MGTTKSYIDTFWFIVFWSLNLLRVCYKILLWLYKSISISLTKLIFQQKYSWSPPLKLLCISLNISSPKVSNAQLTRYKCWDTLACQPSFHQFYIHFTWGARVSDLKHNILAPLVMAVDKLVSLPVAPHNDSNDFDMIYGSRSGWWATAVCRFVWLRTAEAIWVLVVFDWVGVLCLLMEIFIELGLCLVCSWNFHWFWFEFRTLGWGFVWSHLPLFF